MNRRDFLKRSSLWALSAAAAGSLASCQPGSTGRPASGTPEPGPAPLPEATWRRLPRWRGFNLLSKFMAHSNQPFPEEDFQIVSDWGFDFVRLPMDYRCWTDPDDWTGMKEDQLAQIDQAVEFGRKYRIHVSLNFHRAPGYTVARPAEKLDLWTDPEAQRVCAMHWAAFARRYRGRPSRELSFDLVNEPARIDNAVYAAAAAKLVDAIRAEDPERLIIADGNQWGSKPVPELIPLKVAQSTRGYAPAPVTHHQASWVNSADFPPPAWPLKEKNGRIYDRSRFEAEQIRPWQELAAEGVGVHVGEFGCFNKTPHGIVMAWMTDCLELWRQQGWGWALWNLRGSFGVLDSDRADVQYEDFRGHRLDGAMLDLLRAH